MKRTTRETVWQERGEIRLEDGLIGRIWTGKR